MFQHRECAQTKPTNINILDDVPLTQLLSYLVGAKYDADTAIIAGAPKSSPLPLLSSMVLNMELLPLMLLFVLNMVLDMVLLDMDLLLDTELLLVPAWLEALPMPDTEDERLMLKLMLMDTELFLQLLFLP